MDIITKSCYRVVMGMKDCKNLMGVKEKAARNLAAQTY